MIDIDQKMKEWIVSLPYNKYTKPNQLRNIRYTMEGKIFLRFDGDL